MSNNIWRCRCGKRVEVLTDENFGDCGCSDPVYGPDYFYMSKECADMLDEMDKDYDEQHKQLAEARAEIERKDKLIEQMRADIEKATATEAERWAERLNWLHTKYGADCSGTDSADLLDCVEDEIKQVINSQSELIEQMREALRLALSEARSTHCEQTILAALAAERGERK